MKYMFTDIQSQDWLLFTITIPSSNGSIIDDYLMSNQHSLGNDVESQKN
jgi:hypothetical protein